MGSAILFTAAHMQEIEDATVTSMSVDGSGHLIVTRHDGSTFDAGDVSTWLPGRLKAANNLGAAVDPDSLVDSGWYAASSWISTLAGYSFGAIEVLAYDATHIVQNFWTIEASPRRFKRAKFGASWTAWVEQDAYASSAETLTGAAIDRAVTPKALADLWADPTKAGTTTTRGLLKLALSTDAFAGVATDTAVKPSSLTYIRDNGFFDPRYYTENEVDTLIKTQLVPTGSAFSGGAITTDTDGTIRVTTNGVTSVSLDGILALGRIVEIDIIWSLSASTNPLWRLRKATVDYSGASAYITDGIYASNNWSSGSSAGYGQISNSSILCVNGGSIGLAHLTIIGTATATAPQWHSFGRNRGGASSTAYNAAGDHSIGVTDPDGITLFLTGSTFQIGTEIKVWKKR